MSALQITWFWLIFLLLTVYAVLDGFDLGSGFWYLFAKWDRDKRTILNSIGPFWDGNEVWLLTGAGSIFAAFPHVYATVFSGFYLPFMLIIFSFILRAVSIEFRNKIESSAWQNFWGLCFSVGSIVPTFLFGVAAGNIMRGLPLNEYMGYTGNFIFLLNPFALLIGFLSLAAFATHAATYLVIRIKGEIISMARSWVVKSWRFYIVLFIITFMVIYYTQPRLLDRKSVV